MLSPPRCFREPFIVLAGEYREPVVEGNLSGGTRMAPFWCGGRGTKTAHVPLADILTFVQGSWIGYSARRWYRIVEVSGTIIRCGVKDTVSMEEGLVTAVYLLCPRAHEVALKCSCQRSSQLQII